MFSQVISHLGGVVSQNGNVMELTVLLGRIGEQLHVLGIVDFDKGDSDRAVVALERKRFLKSQKVFIEGAGVREIAGIEGDVCHPENSRSLRFRLR